MNLNKILGITAAVLAGYFVLGLAVRYHQKPPRHLVASWAEAPATIGETKKLADQIVLGRVVRIRRGDDLTVRAAGEPGSVDRVPTECVTIRTETTYKGKEDDLIEVFHTGLSKGNTGADRGEPPGPPPKMPPGGIERPPGGVHPDPNAVRSVILDDDPLYKTGEQVLLFLRKGPRLKVGNEDVDTMALVAPEGRFSIDEKGRINAATGRHQSGQFDGRSLHELEAEIMKQ